MAKDRKYFNQQNETYKWTGDIDDHKLIEKQRLKAEWNLMENGN